MTCAPALYAVAHSVASHDCWTSVGAEAAVLLDRALQITDVDAQTFAPAAPAWAAQSAANLSTCGMLDDGEDLSAALTRGQAAELICSALELLDSRDTGWF